jgi:HK97 family phage portal protein
MGFLANLFNAAKPKRAIAERGRERRSIENPAVPLSAEELWDLLGGGHAESGVRVNRETALTHNVFWRCVNLLSGDIAKMPLTLFERKGAGKTEDTLHPAHHLMGYEFVPGEMSALVGKRTLTYHALCEGNGYAAIIRDGAGNPRELWPLMPHRTYPVRVNRKLWYVTEIQTDNGLEERKIPAADMFHLKGLSFDGFLGYCAIHKMRETLGLGMAYDLYGSTFFRNNARPNIIIRYPKRLSPEAAKNLRESFDRIHAGLENAHRAAVLEEGGDITQLTINARDAQLLEGMAFSRVSIANFFGVPAHKVGSPINTSYGSLEQENESYLEDGGGLGYWMPAWCSEAWAKLLTEEEKAQKTHLFLFKTRQLLKANTQARTAYFTALVDRGILSQNEVREEEGYNPREGGDTYMHAANMVIEGEEPETPDDPNKPPVVKEKEKPPDDGEEDGTAAADTARSAFLHAAGRMVRRLHHVAMRAAKKPATFNAFLNELESRHLVVVTDALRPFETPWGAVTRATQLIGAVSEALLAVSGECRAAELPAKVTERMTELEASLPAMLARSAKPTRDADAALQILERLPDAAAGKIAVQLPVAANPPYTVTEDDLRDLPTQTVKIQDLTATQPYVFRAHVAHFIRNPKADDEQKEADDHQSGNVVLADIPGDKPYVIRAADKEYLYDGHHRITANQLLGVTKVEAYYYEAPKGKDGERQGRLPFRRSDDGTDNLDEKANLMAEILVESLDHAGLKSLLAELRYSDDQPRGPDGRWIAAGDASHQAARELIGKHGAGKVPAQKAKELHEHLSKMTVKQLHELKREHGLKASGNKAELAAKLAERIKAKLEKDAGKNEGKEGRLKPGELHEPGKPMAERLATYKEADKIIDKLAPAGKAHAEAVERYDRSIKDMNQKNDAHQEAVSRRDPYVASGEKIPRGMSKAVNDTYKELQKARIENQDAWNHMQKTYQAAHEAGQNALKDLKATNPINLTRVDQLSAKDPFHAERSEKALEYVHSITEQGSTTKMDPVVVRPTPPGSDDRAFFKGREHGSPHETVNTHSTDDVGTHVHELGHYLENNVKGVREAAQEFLNHRVGKEAPQNLKTLFPQSTYKDHEEGRKDNFDRAFSGSVAWYVGKVYAKDTEIVSMGLEKVYRDPTGFAAKDPEYFKFIHGILSGHLRKE